MKLGRAPAPSPQGLVAGKVVAAARDPARPRTVSVKDFQQERAINIACEGKYKLHRWNIAQQNRQFCQSWNGF